MWRLVGEGRFALSQRLNHWSHTLRHLLFRIPNVKPPGASGRLEAVLEGKKVRRKGEETGGGQNHEIQL